MKNQIPSSPDIVGGGEVAKRVMAFRDLSPDFVRKRLVADGWSELSLNSWEIRRPFFLRRDRYGHIAFLDDGIYAEGDMYIIAIAAEEIELVEKGTYLPIQKLTYPSLPEEQGWIRHNVWPESFHLKTTAEAVARVIQNDGILGKGDLFLLVEAAIHLSKQKPFPPPHPPTPPNPPAPPNPPSPPGPVPPEWRATSALSLTSLQKFFAARGTVKIDDTILPASRYEFEEMATQVATLEPKIRAMLGKAIKRAVKESAWRRDVNSDPLQYGKMATHPFIEVDTNLGWVSCDYQLCETKTLPGGMSDVSSRREKTSIPVRRKR